MDGKIRVHYELERNKKELAKHQRRPMASTAEESPSAKETRKTE
jgi:hypothetical protein